MKGVSTMKISETLWGAIETHLDLAIREWVHLHYSPCLPEDFLEEYCLRLAYEYGEDELDAFGEMLYHEFGIDLSDIYTELDLEDASRAGGWEFKMSNQTRKKIQHIMRVHQN